MNDLQRLIDAVAQARADIAPTYHEYVQLAFALATECGEVGRSHFHDLCRYSPKYDGKNADKVYTSALSSNRGDVKIATAYHLAKQAGVVVMYNLQCTKDKGDVQCANVQYVQAASHTRAHTREEQVEHRGTETQSEVERYSNGDELLCGSDPLQPLPHFPAYDWPEPLPTILKCFATPEQQDIMLLGTLDALGATLGWNVRCLYGGKEHSPCLQLFVVAPPASGKGVLALLRPLVLPVHDELRSRYEQERAIYRKEKAAYDALGKNKGDKEPPELPVNKLFLIPGNNSGTGILQNLIDAGGLGLIIETEADTLSNAIHSDYGHFSDTLRRCFDHDWQSYNRRKDDEYREVSRSFLSVVLSGTPAQVRPLIPSAENGLFSRQLFYYMRGTDEWEDQFDEEDTNQEALFTAIGKEWKRRLDVLKKNGVYDLRLSGEQKRAFNLRFRRLLRHSGLVNGKEMKSSVKRLGINFCRILSVVAMLRGEFTPAKDIPKDNIQDGIIPRWDVPVRTDDFEAVMGLMETLYHHAVHILSFLPGTEVKRRPNSECELFFAALPNSFTREQFKQRVAAQGVNENTANSWLRRLLQRGSLRQEGDVYMHAYT